MRYSARAVASTTIPNQTNNYTLLNTNPPYTSILNCTWSTGLEIPTLGNPFVAGVCPAAAALGLTVTDPWNQPTPRMNQWSASVERQLWNGGGVELQYLGSHSYHLDRSYYNNTPLPGPGAVNSRRPNPKFGDIRTFAMDEIANYESMTVNFHQRAAHGLMVNASYTWAHTLDVSTDSNSGGTPMNPYWWRADYGNANWDIRHRVLTTFNYDIPFFQTNSALVKGVFGELAGEWHYHAADRNTDQCDHQHRYGQHQRARFLPTRPGRSAQLQLRERPPDRLHR